MKQLIQLLAFFMLTLFAGCSNDDDPMTGKGKEHVKEITQVLEDLVKSDEGYSEFLKAFKAASNTIAANIGDEGITVFAAKNYVATKANSKGTLERHIAKGRFLFLTFSTDTSVLTSIGGEQIIYTHKNGIYYINGIPMTLSERANNTRVPG